MNDDTRCHRKQGLLKVNMFKELGIQDCSVSYTSFSGVSSLKNHAFHIPPTMVS